MNAFAQLTDFIETAPSQHFDGLKITPIILNDETQYCPPFKSLSAALEDGSLKITEISESGSVPELQAKNMGEEAVLILDGEELIGAKQNRIANITILVPPLTDIIIPVSCVEAGRWSYRDRNFKSSGHVHYPSARAKKAGSVSDSLKHRRSRKSDQQEVWADVDIMLAALAVPSETGSISDGYESKAAQIDSYVSEFTLRPNQIGLIYVLDDRIWGIDLFGSPHVLADAFPKLIRGAALQAIAGSDKKIGLSGDQTQFFQNVLASEFDRYNAVGLGQDVRFSSPGITGGALEVEGKLVHLFALANDHH